MNYTSMVSTSLASLYQSRYASLALLLIGLLAFVTNAATLFTVTSRKKLRESSAFFMVANLAVADLIVGGSYTVTGAKRLVRLLLEVPEVDTQLNCCLEMLLPYFGFRHLEWQFAFTFAPVGWLLGIIGSGFMFAGVSGTELIPNCYIVSSATPEFYSLQVAIKNVLVGAITLIYATIVGIVYYQMHFVKHTAQQLADIKRSVQVKVAQMLAIVGIIYFFTQLLPLVFLASLTGLTPEERRDFGPYTRSLLILNSAVNIFVYYFRSTDFKNELLIAFGKHHNSVAPVVSAHFHTHQATRHHDDNHNALNNKRLVKVCPT